MHSFLHMQQVLRCGTIWRHYKDDFISSDLIGQKSLNDRIRITSPSSVARKEQDSEVSTSHIGITFAVRWLIKKQARSINLRRKRRDWGENFGKSACLFRQTLYLVLFYIDLEVSQLWQSPSDQTGIFSVSYRKALFPHPAGTTTTVSLQSVNVFKDWSCFI